MRWRRRRPACARSCRSGWPPPTRTSRSPRWSAAALIATRRTNASPARAWSIERNTKYVPRADGTPDGTAGPKVAHFDRIEWQIIPDAGTVAAAMQNGEIDWWLTPNADLLPLLQKQTRLKVETVNPTGTIATMRFNHLNPPFDNPALRRAMLGAVEQSDYMIGAVGTDENLWRDQGRHLLPRHAAGDQGRHGGADRQARPGQGQARHRGRRLQGREGRGADADRHPAGPRRRPRSPPTGCTASASTSRRRRWTGRPWCSVARRPSRWSRAAGASSTPAGAAST